MGAAFPGNVFSSIPYIVLDLSPRWNSCPLQKKLYLKAIMKQLPAGPSWPGPTWAWLVLLGSLTIAAAQWMAVLQQPCPSDEHVLFMSLNSHRIPYSEQFYLSALPNPGGSCRDDAALWKINFCRVPPDGAVCFGTYEIQHHHQDSDRGEKSTQFSNWYSCWADMQDPQLYFDWE